MPKPKIQSFNITLQASTITLLDRLDPGEEETVFRLSHSDFPAVVVGTLEELRLVLMDDPKANMTRPIVVNAKEKRIDYLADAQELDPVIRVNPAYDDVESWPQHPGWVLINGVAYNTATWLEMQPFAGSTRIIRFDGTALMVLLPHSAMCRHVCGFDPDDVHS